MQLYLRFENFAAKAFTMSYDDNRTPMVPLASLMKKYGIRGTFNLNSGLFRERDDEHFCTLETAQKVLCDCPLFEIAMHGATHPYLDRISPEECAYEITEDKHALAEQFGTKVEGLAYPGGTYSAQVMEIAEKCGAVYGRTINSHLGFDLPTNWFEWAPSCHGCKEHAPVLFERLLNMTVDAEPKLLYLWGHPNEFDIYGSWEFTEEMFKTLSERDDIWRATNLEIYYAVKNFEALEVNGNEIKNPTDATVWVNANGKNVKLLPSEKVTV